MTRPDTESAIGIEPIVVRSGTPLCIRDNDMVLPPETRAVARGASE